MIYITRRERFSAAHRLFNPDWTDEKNQEVFGNCANPNWHGHNYTLWVTVKGDIDPDLGYLCDLKALGKLIRKEVIEHLDHRNINLEVDFMKDKRVSTENLAIAIWERIQEPIEQMKVHLHSVKLEETENNYVEYFGK
jgi:6-pyruvoyltetrahydropterin/6-carboxytetrahydropterin synthase